MTIGNQQINNIFILLLYSMNRSQKLPTLKKGSSHQKNFPKTPSTSFVFPEKENVHADFSDDKEFHSIKAK